MSHLRIIVIMMALAAAGSVMGYFYVSGSFAAGVAIGGVLSLVNYYWMRHSLRMVFRDAQEGARQGFGGGSYMLRYVAFGTILAAVYLFDWEMMVPLILGLSSFALAVVFEGIIRLIGSFSIKGI